MVGWHRHVKSLLQNAGKRVERSYSQSANSSCSRVDSFRTAAELPSLRRFLKPCCPIVSRPVYQYYQQLGISTSRKLLADETPVQSPLLAIGSGNGDDEQNKPVKKQEKVQAVLKCIKQSPKKMNLVAALVRGMRVEDALLQLQVTVKRAAKTVYRVIHSARANATHNHGLDAERLLVAEAYVGKGFYKKRISYHAKGRSGIRERPECRLTVVVRETTPEEEAKIARLKVHNFRKLSKKEKRLVPHTLIETTSVWSRRVKPENKTASNDEASPTPV